MADPYAELLKRFDPIAIARYQITATDLETIEKYVSILQSEIPYTVWDEVLDSNREYGTSIIIHEIVQIRALREAGIEPLRYARTPLRKILDQYRAPHALALYAEHVYLQETIARKFDEDFQVATLVRANHNDTRDFELLLESEVGIFLFEEEKVMSAQQALARLKGE